MASCLVVIYGEGSEQSPFLVMHHAAAKLLSVRPDQLGAVSRPHVEYVAINRLTIKSRLSDFTVPILST